jgi:hypothetical protein
MLIRQLIRAAAVLVGGLLAVAPAASGVSRAGTASSSSPTVRPVTSVGTSVGSTDAGTGLPAPGPASTTWTAPAVPPDCAAASLELGLRWDGAAAGSTYQDLVFTNAGGMPCLIVGFPGVSYVTGDSGQRVGAPAVRSGVAGAALVLAPRQSAYATVQQANTGNYDPTTCQPTAVRGLRVYPPDNRAAMFVPFSRSTTACANVNLPSPQLLVQTVKSQPAAG